MCNYIVWHIICSIKDKLNIETMIRLQDTLKLMHKTNAKSAIGDNRFGEWCKMTNTYVALKGGGKWYRYYYTNFGGAENPDFDTICKCFYSDSGCYPTASKPFEF